MRSCAIPLLAGALCLSGLASAEERPGPPAPPLGTPSIANPLAGVSASDMTSFLGRPLFSASRRPALPPSSAAPPPAPPAPVALPTADTLRLVGTLASDAGTIALIEDRRRGTTVSVAEGGSVDDWHVAEIRPSLVRLRRGSQVAVLAMFAPGGTAPPDAAPREAPVAARPARGASVTPQPAEPAPSPPPRAGDGTGAAPAGTLPGTAAAAAAALSPFRLSFGDPPPPTDR